MEDLLVSNVPDKKSLDKHKCVYNKLLNEIIGLTVKEAEELLFQLLLDIKTSSVVTP
jgi:hypothetical protein